MIRPAIVPLYLIACLFFGGSSAGGYTANLLLQLLGLPLCGWALLARRESPPPAGARSLLTLAGLLALTMLLQLVPLPPAVWTSLPGREAIIEGYRLLGLPLPWLPLSLAPEATTASLVWLLPAFATLLGMLLLTAFQPNWIAWAIAIVAGLGVGVGALQVMGGDSSAWYFYEITNYGQAVGFFANGNHAATLLVVAIPFVAALQARARKGDQSNRRGPAILVIASAFLLAVAVGLVINSSIAGIGLGIAVAVASVLLLGATTRQQLAPRVAFTVLSMAGAVLAILLGPVTNNLTGTTTSSRELEQLTRRVSISTTIAASTRYLPVGSGVGTFRPIYQQMENPRDTTNTYMNHAHSDVAEIVLETGFIGVVFILLLIAWWVWRTIRLWRAPEPDYFGRAAAIAAGAIMVHSLVDYPLRTAAISALFATCLALMSGIQPLTRVRADHRNARHLRVV